MEVATIGMTSVTHQMNRNISILRGIRRLTTPPSRQCGIMGLFGLCRQISRSSTTNIDLRGKHTQIDDAHKKTQKLDISRAISKWFYFSQIPLHAATNTYYHAMVFEIQASSLAV